MKKISRKCKLLWMLVILALSLFGALPAQAAKVTAPPKVRAAYQFRNDTSITLNWTKSAGAAGYVVIERYKDGKKTRTRQLNTARTYINRTVEPGTTYYYQVRAYSKNGKKKVYSANSNTVKVAVPVVTPTITITKYTSDAVTVSWGKIQNALGYRAYLYNPKASKKYQVYEDTTRRYSVISGLKSGVKYQIVVKAILPKLNGAGKRLGPVSNVLKAQVSKVVLPGVHGRYWSATVKYNVYAKVNATGKKILLKKGTKLVCSSRTNGSVTAKITTKAEATNAVVVTVPGKALNFGALAVTSSSKYVYTKEQKESYINSTSLSSSTGYLIWVSQFTCQATVFQGSQGHWRQVRSMNCIVGQYGNTPQGKFRIRKRGIDPDLGIASWFTWSDTLNWGNAFHHFVDKRSRGAHSHGCVRLSTSDNNYVYYNIPMGTTVWSY